MTAMAHDDTQTSPVQSTELADGVLIRLDGELSAATVDRLRAALLRSFPASCKDVIVDAGAVTAVDETSLAVLLAAKDWVRSGKRRFALSRSCPALDEALRSARLGRALPRLGPPRRRSTLPAQRTR